MQNRAELYFIAAMMILIFVVCGVAVYAFFKTLKKEKAEHAREKQIKKQNAKSEN